MYKIGDKVIVVKHVAGRITGKGTWGIVSQFLDSFDGPKLGVVVYHYRKKNQATWLGMDLSEWDRFTIFLDPAQVDLYSNVVSPKDEVIKKIKLMHNRQSFKFQGV